MGNNNKIDQLQTEINHKKDLMEQNKNGMRQLELKKAKYGPLNVPSHIMTELDEYKREIDKLKSQIGNLEVQLKKEKFGHKGSNPPGTGGGTRGQGGTGNPPGGPGGRGDPNRPPTPPEPARPPGIGSGGGIVGVPPSPRDPIKEKIAKQLPNVMCVIYMEGYQNNNRVYVYGSVLGHRIETLIREVKGPKLIDIVKAHNFGVMEQGKNTPSVQVKQRMDEKYLFDHKLTRVRLFPSNSNNQTNAPAPNTTAQTGLFEQFRRNIVGRFFRNDTTINNFQICRVNLIQVGMIAVFNPTAYVGNEQELDDTAKLAQHLAKLNTSKFTVFAASKWGMGDDKIEPGESLASLLKRLFPRQSGT